MSINRESVKSDIDRLRDKLNKRSELSPNLSDVELLELSRSLDELINYYYRSA